MQQPATVPLDYAIPIPANPSETLVETIQPLVRALPIHLRHVVSDHLDGFSQDAIARRNRIHRNTVGNRMKLAEREMGCWFPNFENFWDTRLFRECAQQVTYTKQNDMPRFWKNNHPPEPRPARVEDMGDEEGLRPCLVRDLYCPDPFLNGAKRRVDAKATKGRAVPRKRSWKAVA